MNTELLHRILDDARQAASPSEADDIRMLMIDLDMMPSDDLAELVNKAARFDDIKGHFDVQPFDIIDNDDGTTAIEGELTGGAFARWFGTLEDLAA